MSVADADAVGAAAGQAATDVATGVSPAVEAVPAGPAPVPDEHAVVRSRGARSRADTDSAARGGFLTTEAPSGSSA